MRRIRYTIRVPKRELSETMRRALSECVNSFGAEYVAMDGKAQDGTYHDADFIFGSGDELAAHRVHIFVAEFSPFAKFKECESEGEQ